MQVQNADLTNDDDLVVNSAKNKTFAVEFLKVLRQVQEEMKGEAEKAGLYTDEDVMNLVKEIRDEDSD